MKKIILLLVGVMFFGLADAYNGFGDDDDDKKRRRRKRRGATTEIGINPFGYLFGNYNLLGGYNFSEQSAIYVELAYTRNKFPYTGLDTNTGFPVLKDVVFSGFSIAPEFRYYFSPDDANDRWFIGGYLKFRTSSTSGQPYMGFDKDDEPVFYDLKNVALIPGITFGYHLVTNSNLTFTFWTGGGYALLYNETKDPDFAPSTSPGIGIVNEVFTTFNKLDFRGGITVGYRF
jgi:hypothetical protein